MTKSVFISVIKLQFRLCHLKKLIVDVYVMVKSPI